MSGVIRILGIDPGLRATGWGLLNRDGARLVFRDCGVLAPPSDAPLSERLGRLSGGLRRLLHDHPVDLAAVETVHVALNPVASLALGQARGAILAALGEAGLRTIEYPPNTVKKSVCGAGKAPKEQVAFMVRRLLPAAKPKSQDAVDALALALCAALRGEAAAPASAA